MPNLATNLKIVTWFLKDGINARDNMQHLEILMFSTPYSE